MNVSDFKFWHHYACACVLARPTTVTLLNNYWRKRGAHLAKVNMTDTEKKGDAPVLIAVDDGLVTQWVNLKLYGA